MSFLVLLSSKDAAVDLAWLDRRRSEISAQRIDIVGKTRQVAFAWMNAGSDLSIGLRANYAVIEERYWLIGRVRLDAREELRSALSLGYQSSLKEAPDALLCLRAYAHWGERCVEHLKGDFCFVIWDESRQRLFCARDQIGVRPLFYAESSTSWLISDSLYNITSERNIKTDLDNYWIADFLSIGFCIDFERTVYKYIKRVPPAHALLVSQRESTVHRYWILEIREPIYYRNPKQYIEHFNEVVSLAVKDRLPSGRIGISLSGGLDSSTLAAHAMQASGDPSRVVAFTQYFKHLLPDDEMYFSSLVAKRLGIPQTLWAVDESCYDSQWHLRDTRTAEPDLNVVRAVHERVLTEEMARLSPVWFFGEGPDNALKFEWRRYLWWLAGQRNWLRFAGTAIQYVRNKQAREWYDTIRNSFRQVEDKTKTELQLFAWLDSGFAKDVDLKGRLRESSNPVGAMHPWHPRAMASFSGAIWPNFLESLDPAISKTPLDWRHPFLDIRVLTYMLSVPPIPWARRKRLMREAMRGELPDEIISRDKAPLVGDPVEKMLRTHLLPQLARTGAIGQFLDLAKLPNVVSRETDLHQLLKVHVLDFWLRTHGSN